ncbi:MAG: hypothetical protein WCI52_02720 [bacterium]
MKEKNTVGFIIKLVALVGLAIGATIYSLGFSSSTTISTTPIKNTTPVSTPTPTPTPVVTKETSGTPLNQAPAPVSSNYIYKNGTYTAVGSYEAPSGTEQITITLTIKDDIVTDASGSTGAYDRTSLRYENAFLSGFKQYVVGKNISSLQLGKISGASLTPQGFNDALSQIKSQAKA